MKLIREILDALASPGGNLVILCVAVLLSGTAAVLVGHRNDEVDNFLLSVFSSFTGALLQALTTRPWRQGEASGKEEPILRR